MAFVGVAAGIVILIAAFNFRQREKCIPFYSCGLRLSAPLWFCINLITLFTNYTNVTYMTENMMDMFSMILVTFFLLSQGKMFARVNPVKSGGNEFMHLVCQPFCMDLFLRCQVLFCKRWICLTPVLLK